MTPRRLPFVPSLRSFALLAVVGALSARAQESAPASRAAAPNLTGSFTTEKGVRTLKLWGPPHSMGFAHGYLLAEEIVPFVEEFVVNLPFIVGVEKYVNQVVPYVESRMVFTKDEEDEIAGIVDGVTAKLGRDGTMLKSLGRPLAAIDLKAGNTFGDWAGFACSSFSVWGALTENGRTITARNFDYFPHPKLEKLVLLSARAPADPAKRRWVTVGYPGLIGAISGMNEEGLGLFVHDVMPSGDVANRGLAPRLLVLRRALETVGVEGATAGVHALLRATTTAMGNNIQVTSPFDGKTIPAGIVEYDGVESRDEGATLRGPDEGRSFVICSNHHRLRAAPSRCARYGKIEKALAAAAAAGEKIDFAKAREIIGSATQSGFSSQTLHTVLFSPSERRFELMLSRGMKVAPKCDPVAFTVEELLPKR